MQIPKERVSPEIGPGGECVVLNFDRWAWTDQSRGADQLDGVFKPRVERCIRRAKVVEAPQHVVVPARRKVEAGEFALGDLAGTVAARIDAAGPTPVGVL